MKTKALTVNTMKQAICENTKTNEELCHLYNMFLKMAQMGFIRWNVFEKFDRETINWSWETVPNKLVDIETMQVFAEYDTTTHTTIPKKNITFYRG